MGNEDDNQPAVKTTSLAPWKQQRSSSKGSLTRIKTIVETTNTLSHIELECRLGMVESYYKQAAYYQSQIESLDSTDTGRNDLDELYVAVKSKIKSLIEERKPKDANQHEQSFIYPTISQNRLPTLQLPRFDGNYMEFKNFMHSFNNLVHNDQVITKIEKFNHLLTCLRGEALAAVKAYQVTEANYDLAIARLKERYDNETLIFLENVSALFSVPAISKADSKQLRNISDTISALYNSLKSISTAEQILDAVVIHLVMSKVDSGTKQRWEEQLSYTKLPSWTICCTMLDKRCQQLDAQGKRHDTQASNQGNIKLTKKNSKQYSLLVKQNENPKAEKICVFCTKRNHIIMTCQQFVVLPLKEREEKVSELRLCVNCLCKGHAVSECPSKYSCRFCKARHHSLLHQHKEFSTQSVPTSTSTAASAHATMVMAQNSSTSVSLSESVHSSLVGNKLRQIKSTVILATAIILVQDSSGCFQFCRALLDSCSQVNLMTHSFARLLNLAKSKASVDLSGIGNSSVKLTLQTQTTIRSRLSSFEQSTEFLLSSKITNYQPDECISIETLNLPKNIDLADPEFNIPKGIDVLLGTDVFFTLLSPGRIELGAKLPTLQETELGWIVAGKCDTSIMSAPVFHSFCTTFDALNSNVERLWKLEEIVTPRPKFTAEQQQCDTHFLETVQVNDEGRIMVRLPFKCSPSLLGSSRDIALQRFHWLERKLNKNPLLKNDYSLFLQEYEALGHMSLVKNPDLSATHYFIPHHCVLRPNSETTKLRVVFHASCRSASQVSLNDLLLVGPTIQNELFITLTRFRGHQYGLMADISKMYRQIMLHPDDRRFQFILWRENDTQPILTYMLNTITYGTASAPHSAIRSLQYAADMCPLSYELGKSVIRNDFYVDDMVTGADDLQTLKQIKQEVSDVLGYYKMDLCKWHCSHPGMNEIAERELQLNEETTSALGVKWRPDKDEFIFYFQQKISVSSYTKRSVLSFVSSFFDPLGLINPIIIVPRIILQNLWTQKLTWDEAIPFSLEHKLKEFITDLQNLAALHIPRFVRTAHAIETQVHGFCDASSKAYGCCLYIRCKDSSGNITTNLLTSKSRLAPIKTKTLPRLELCSAQLLSKLWSKIQPHLSFEITEVHFWSDSQITLHWIQSESSTLSVFVGNRVADIQNLTTGVNWHHINSSSNPADHISRGCSVQTLVKSNWLHGPDFLRNDSDEWPRQSTPLPSNQLDLERKKTCFINTQKEVPYIIKQIHYYSDYLRCVRTFAYVLRIIKPPPADQRELSAEEIKSARHHIVWAIQHHYFAREITLLKHQKQIKGAMLNLSPFLDQVGNILLLRVGGRLVNANIPVETKHPFLLPKDDQFVISMVTYIHRTNFHAGPRALVALIQQDFWIVNCKALATQIVHSCIHCTRYKPKLLTQVMGSLPKERVSECIPFDVTGVDFAGPIFTYLKVRGKRPYKCYISVFICFASKAVHLEAVSDLSSDAFIAALKRFIGRRGLPAKIFCDNATNFVGANNKLKEFRDFFNQQSTIEAITSYCSNSHIEFSFIPPRAPHFGGLWEAAVKMAKSHLYKTQSNARLTFEELSTALVEIEAVMNSRPLTSLSVDPNDFSVLTPGELLIGKKLKHIPEPVNTTQEISLLDRWKRITAAKSHFWRRWHNEYLSELQRRYRWQHPTRNLQIGDLVTIHDDNLPPMKWLIGRVIRIVEGADGKVRVAEIKTLTSTFTRPITKLALLPVLNPIDSMGAGMLSHQALTG